MAKKKKYKNPPVQEALCEVFFSGTEWDNTIPGSFYAEIQKDYPNKTPLRQAGIEFNLGLKERAVKFLDQGEKINFRKLDNSQVIQLADNHIVVNQLKPYIHFEDWIRVLKEKLPIYQKLSKPKTVNKIGVRYINRIVIPKKEIKLANYFDIYPTMPSQLGVKHGPFMMRLEIPPKISSHQLLVTFASAPAEKPDLIAFVLDIYDIFGKEIQPDTAPIMRIAEEGHDNIVPAFESCIKDSLRELFEEIK